MTSQSFFASLVFLVLVGCQPAVENSADLGLPPPGSRERDTAESPATPLNPGAEPGTSVVVVPPMPAIEQPGSDALLLDEVKLREMLLENNIDVFFGANTVRMAKERVWIARARLLPSLNLGVLATSVANPMFLLSSVQVLLPFLIPNNWFELFKQNSLLKVDQDAFRLVQLNLYASAYSLLIQVQTDFRLRDILIEQESYAADVERFAALAYRSGRGSLDDWNLARAALATARGRLLNIEGMLAEEVAELSSALDRPVGTEIWPSAKSPSVSPLEGLALGDAVDAVNERSIELDQITALRQAAKQERWQKVFAFISSASLSQQVSASDAAAGNSLKVNFGQMTGAGLFNFGFDYFPNLQMANRNLDDIDLRRKQVQRENGRVVEATLNHLSKAVARAATTAEAESFQQDVLDNALLRYQLGFIGLLELIQQQDRFRDANVERWQAEAAVDQLRVTLQRINLEGQFDEIQDCRHLDLSKAMGPWGKKARMPKEACGLERSTSQIGVTKGLRSNQ